MGPVSGVLWLAGAAVGAAGWLLPGSPHGHAALYWTLLAATALYGLGCVTRAIPWHRVPVAGHALVVLAFQPAIVADLWLTGGADSFLGPALVLPMLYVAYFFPPRLAWPLAAVEIATYASPLLYAHRPAAHLLPARTLAYAVAYVGLTATIQFLKRHLVAAERRQRDMAHRDPLTGLANRRAFDAALAGCLAGAERFAVLLADLDDFKGINDDHGHVAGDRVLRELAAHAGSRVRAGDCLARIGGDELALVAPGAGADAAHRLADALREAARQVVPAPGAPPLSVTVGWAVHPGDGADAVTLLEAADAQLNAGKRSLRRGARR
ncbi:MAG TPA: GGDEF domain-containing protein [Solirubrobacteraceae bacterium]|jgi:diguanylate cyclase (GGDEF)-like protein